MDSAQAHRLRTYWSFMQASCRECAITLLLKLTQAVASVAVSLTARELPRRSTFTITPLVKLAARSDDQQHTLHSWRCRYHRFGLALLSNLFTEWLFACRTTAFRGVRACLWWEGAFNIELCCALSGSSQIPYSSERSKTDIAIF